MKIAKKIRLLTKDGKGLFQNNEQHVIMRHRAIVQESTVKESEGNYKTTGVLYVVDEKATAERDKLKAPNALSSIDILRNEYEELMSEKADDSWTITKLKEVINELKS